MIDLLTVKSSDNSIRSVNKRIWVALGNSTHVVSSFNFEISSNSPWSSPRVLDIPESFTTIVSVSCSQNCVINIVSCLTAVVNAVNTSVVVLESSNNLEWNCNWSLFVKFLSEFFFVTLGDVIASESDVTNGNMFSEDTSSILGSVRIS